ncbi:MAG TPA: hypothetical protein VFJ74_16400 [Gemmatimonadaceae bacterium]|nr:hypothetical protein [Gemmatimonadaceae bacterium]
MGLCAAGASAAAAFVPSVASPAAMAATPAAAVAPLSATSARGGAIVVDGALLDSLRGRSGKLRARFLVRTRELALPALQRLFGDPATEGRTEVIPVSDSATGRPFSFITLLPFTNKAGGRVENYRVGFWPAERRAPRSEAYENPAGFIRVTPDNQDTRISEHFELRDFLTHDQQDVWPKYLVLREALVDKLELIIADLEAHGHPVRHLTIMSGFRTPQYNAQGVGRGGRAKDSRHQFGDAADVFVDNDGDGRMDDLNHDRRIDARDAQVIIDAATRVENAHPDLVGGAGRYRATRQHGPFAHIDARGTRARWGNS